ncbi:potassium channel family protein [Microlunatus aurantiacus]|uniref:Potassium channel family protein n=1 Tax=Microlunatus aurantiacus TaxID=446786 RepID=A0ABP7DCJ2_9ACTN
MSVLSGQGLAKGTVRAALVTAARMLGSLVAVMAIYYLLPVRLDDGVSDVPWLLLDVVLFAALVGAQLPLIGRSRHPELRAIEAMTLSIMIFLTLFARLYLSADAGDHAAFSQPLDRTTALYFTITVFATVGFGDIVAQTPAAKVLVSVQMLLNLVVLGLVVRLLLNAGRRAVRRRPPDASPES